MNCNCSSYKYRVVDAENADGDKGYAFEIAITGDNDRMEVIYENGMFCTMEDAEIAAGCFIAGINFKEHSQ